MSVSSISSKYNRTRFVVSRYEFQRGGDADTYLCNFVSDERQGFGVPAKSLMIQNHGGGAGSNFLYYRTIHTNKFGSAPPATLEPDGFINYQLGETIFFAVLIWAANAKVRFSIDATPGEWTDTEVADFQSSPYLKSTLSRIQQLDSLGSLDLNQMEL